MKQFLVAIMAFLMAILTSCQSSSPIEEPQSNQFDSQPSSGQSLENNDLIIRLQSFNDSLTDETLSSRSKGDLYKGIQIAGADFAGTFKGARIGWKIGLLFGPNGGAIGAAIAGPIMGAAASYQAYRKYESQNQSTRSTEYPRLEETISAVIQMKESTSDYTQHYPRIISLVLPSSKRLLQLYGAQHNLILDNIKNNRFSNSQPESVFNEIECSVINHPDFQKAYDEILSAPDKILPANQSQAIVDRVIMLYSQAVMRANSYKDIETISNRYISEVSSNNELSIKDEDNVISSICVMASSSEFWDAF